MKNDIFNLCLNCQRKKEVVCHCKSYIPIPKIQKHSLKSLRKHSKNYYKRHRDKVLIRMKTWANIKKGIIKRKPCSVCGNIKSEIHHNNYNNCYDIMWLCKKHHWELHNLLKINL
jgi:hypothetical protein